MKASLQGDSYKTFCKFFKFYSHGVDDRYIKISLSRFQALLNILKIKCIRKECPLGSSLLVNNVKYDNIKYYLECTFEKGIWHSEAIIIIPYTYSISNSDWDYLYGRDIKCIRYMFLSYGLYPDHLKEILKSEKFYFKTTLGTIEEFRITEN